MKLREGNKMIGIARLRDSRLFRVVSLGLVISRKGFLGLLLGLILLVGVLLLGTKQTYAFTGTGNGTELDPFVISNCVQLQEMQDNLSAYYILGGTIDCSDTVNWNGNKGFEPVGVDSTSPFTGSLDGNDNVINNLRIVRADDNQGLDGDEINSGADQQYVGLFGYINDATVKDVSLAYARIKGFWDVGGIVGYADNSTLLNLSVNEGSSMPHTDGCETTYCIWARYGERGGGIAGTMSGGTLDNAQTGANVKGSGQIMGGLVGYAENATITNSSSTAGVDGGYRVGGLVGEAINVEIQNSSASGRIDTVYEYQVDKFGNSGGGLVGSATDSVITYSSASGDVYGSNYIGGLIGYATDVVANNVSASGVVTGNSSETGGLIGTNEGGNAAISSATASGDVFGNSIVGGMFGFTTCGATIDDAIASGNVTSTGNYIGGTGNYIGGFIGLDGCEGPSSTITESSSRGNVTSTGDYVGGFIGSTSSTTISRSYSTSDVSTTGNSVGGMIGFYGSNSAMTDSFSRGNVVGEDFVGGLIGQNEGDSGITNVYATGLVDGNVTVGGLVAGSEDGANLNATASLWDTQTTGTSLSIAGTGKTTAQMKDLNTFTTELGIDAWDFATIWKLDSDINNGYPCLQWVEECGSADVDFNGDGIVDEDQPNVGSYISPITGKRVVIDVGEGCELTVDDLTEESGLPFQDGGYVYKNGLFDFAGDCGGPGFTTTITLYHYGVSREDSIVRKFNPNTNQYGTIQQASISEQVINGQNAVVVSYQITDGGLLDTDQQVNGEFEDPAGLATAVSNTQNQLASTGQPLQSVAVIGGLLMLVSVYVLHSKVRLQKT